jgi:hypothetical protein
MYSFISNLRMGDIVLVRGAKLHSKLIAKMTNGRFSHALIVLENGLLLEAITGSGVQTTSMIRILFKDKANFVVLRCSFPDEQTKTNCLTYISRNYASYQGHEYSLLGARKSIDTSEGDYTDGGYFCSHLIAAIYADAGFPLFDKPPHKINPNELLESKFLQDISAQVTSELTEVDLVRINESGVKCIDEIGGSTESKDALNHRKLLKEIKKYFNRHGVAEPKTSTEIIDILTDPKNRHVAKKLDYQISKKYKQIGINKYLHDSDSTTNYKEDRSEILSEIELYGYVYALDVYTQYQGEIALC